MIWLTRLTEAARKATKGPWRAKKTPYRGHASAAYYIMTGKRAVAHIKHSTISPVKDNATYIALCSPERILALVEVAARARLYASDPDALEQALSALDTLE